MSDALKELIYSEVYTGGSSSSAILSSLESLSGRQTEKQSADQGAELRKRINRVSEDFGISKKRIEAVLKLKEHERGMKDRGEVSSLLRSTHSHPFNMLGLDRRRFSSMMKQKHDITFVLKTSS